MMEEGLIKGIVNGQNVRTEEKEEENKKRGIKEN
jgi:hypothetical protein